MNEGYKADENKPRLDMVLGEFSRALWGVGLVGTKGGEKYGDTNWLQVENGMERYSNALLRHYLNYRSGEVNDADDGLPHLAHLAWNALAILELYMRGYKKSPEEDAIKQLLYGKDRPHINEIPSDHPDYNPINRGITATEINEPYYDIYYGKSAIGSIKGQANADLVQYIVDLALDLQKHDLEKEFVTNPIEPKKK